MKPMAWTREGSEARSADRAAELRRALDRHGPALVLYARQWCRDPEDIVQEALLKLAAQRTWPDNVAGWLFRVVRNAAVSSARSAARRSRHESAASRPAWFVTNNGQHLDAAAATNAMQALPLEQREVLIAHLWGGLTFDQIAGLAGCSSSTAHRRYLTGLQALRERLDRHDP
jgi:RNA polymerase sigma factor (sigma-70 family)